MILSSRTNGFGPAAGLLALTLAVACSPAESRDNPADEALPAGEAATPSPTGEEVGTSGTVLGPEERRAVPAPPPSPGVTVPSGTRMTFRIAQSLSTESSHAGDRFQATLVGDVSSGAGSVLIPSGAVANGLVVVAEESPSSDVPAVLELRLESLEVDGKVHTLRGTVTAADVKSETRDSGSATAAKVAVGTAAGALVGQIIGRDTRGTLIGAGAGAVAGTAVAVTTNDGHAKIEEGGTLTVLLDEPIALR